MQAPMRKYRLYNCRRQKEVHGNIDYRISPTVSASRQAQIAHDLLISTIHRFHHLVRNIQLSQASGFVMYSCHKVCLDHLVCPSVRCFFARDLLPGPGHDSKVVSKFQLTYSATFIPMPSSPGTAQHGFERSQTHHNSKSFSRIQPKTSSPLRSRASTLPHAVVPDNDPRGTTDMMAEVNSRLEEDIFEKTNAATANGANIVQPLAAQELPEGFDDLPIELISLIDR